ncbi:MAG: hypothetical protein ACI9VR_000725 [Cognaticolwellia sp.]|jgi:hypothetical protein
MIVEFITQEARMQDQDDFKVSLEALKERLDSGLERLPNKIWDKMESWLTDEMPTSRRVHVFPTPVHSETNEGSQWALFWEHGPARVESVAEPELTGPAYSSKVEAVDLAREAARTLGAVLVIHRSDGSVQSTYHYPGETPADEVVH